MVALLDALGMDVPLRGDEPVSVLDLAVDASQSSHKRMEVAFSSRTRTWKTFLSSVQPAS